MTTAFDQRTIASYLADLSSPQPTPGGGAAAALTLAQGAALLSMVCRISNKSQDAVLDKTAQMAKHTVDQAVASCERDMAAFAHLMKALKLPKTCPAEQEVRRREVEAASVEAGRIPLEGIALAVTLLEEAKAVQATVSQHLQSDLGVLSSMTLAAAESLRFMVLINLKTIKAESTKKEWSAALASQMTKIKALSSEISRKVEEGL